MSTDLDTGSISAAVIDSDEESLHDSSEEDNAYEDEAMRDKHCRDVKKSVDFYMQQCNTENGRLPHSGFDVTCRRYLSHYMNWIGTCRFCRLFVQHAFHEDDKLLWCSYNMRLTRC